MENHSLRFTTEFYRIFKEELMQTFLNLFHEIEREGALLKTLL
jgi:hypothetical protein